jgi:hypothetical protein
MTNQSFRAPQEKASTAVSGRWWMATLAPLPSLVSLRQSRAHGRVAPPPHAERG